MKRVFIIFLLAGFFSVSLLQAQEENSLDWNIDTIFDEPTEAPDSEETNEEVKNETAPAKTPAVPTSVVNLIKRRGITFETSFEFTGGMAPGWNQAPWFLHEFDDDDIRFSKNLIVKMRAYFILDSQISKDFRVRTRFYYQIPSYSFTLQDFYFDYTLYDTVFFRAGKYNYSWGISGNFRFTNLLARIPENKLYYHDPFIFKVDVPIGIGGIQLLTLTRIDLMKGNFDFLGWDDFGYGGKYNLALRWADFDLGVFYQDKTPLRSFLSIKTTLWNIELYNEWLLSVDVNNSGKVSGALNLGFMYDFFAGKFSVAGELYYNNEENALWYNPETSFLDAYTCPFIEGFNMALNLVYRFGGKANPRVFLQSRYAPAQNTAQLIPGFRISPWQYLELYIAVPMALGDREGYYYTHNYLDPKNRPFSVMMLLRLRGSVRASYNY